MWRGPEDGEGKGAARTQKIICFIKVKKRWFAMSQLTAAEQNKLLSPLQQPNHCDEKYTPSLSVFE